MHLTFGSEINHIQGVCLPAMITLDSFYVFNLSEKCLEMNIFYCQRTEISVQCYFFTTEDFFCSSLKLKDKFY